MSTAILGLPFTAHQHAAPWGEPRPAVQKRILKLKPGSPCFFFVFIRAGNVVARRLWEEMVFSPNFTSLILIRGDELRVRAPMACLPSRERLTVGEFYLLHSTSRGDMQLLLAHVRAMDLDVWPADGTALVTKSVGPSTSSSQAWRPRQRRRLPCMVGPVAF